MAKSNGNATQIEPPARRHDLDAVRAFAMLLGIALHAALAYADFPWPARDPAGSPFYWHFFSFVHGFRMPLFFMLSGFFTAMLCSRRGVGGLLSHRAKRIALPLAVGLFTIVPLSFVTGIGAAVVTGHVQKQKAERGPDEAPRTIWEASAAGDTGSIEVFLGQGADIDSTDPVLGVTPLGWAAAGGHDEAVSLLLEGGADPNGRYVDRNAPLHTACFFGRAGVAELLIDAGADVDAMNASRETPPDSMAHGRGTVDFFAGMLNVEVDFRDVEAGRARIWELLEREPSENSRRFVRAALMEFPIFYHLWFLWHLCWLVAGFAILVMIGRLLPRVPAPRALCTAPLCMVWLVPVTAVLQLSMDANTGFPVFGPDTSASIVPMPRVLVYYGVFFGFGALLYNTVGAGVRVGRWWWLYMSVGAALYVPVMGLIYNAEQAAELIPSEGGRAAMAAGGQALFAWLMIFGTIGLFEALLSRERAWVRYVSDSAYWLYLAHIPLVFVVQTALVFVDLPGWSKFVLSTAGVTVILLASYQLVVRYTFIGRVLNGPRTRPGAA